MAKHKHIPANLLRDQKSILLYVESCCVDYGGLLEARRMNDGDHGNLRMFMADGLLAYGRIPSRLLPGVNVARPATHWCTLTAEGWALVAELRKERGRAGITTYHTAKLVYAELLDRHDDSWKIADRTNEA